METLSSKIKEEAYKLTRQHGDIDVIVCRDDIAELESEFSMLSSLILDYFLGKNRQYFAVVRFRGNSVDADKIADRKSSIEECKISKDLMHGKIGVPYVDKDWRRKHDENLYKTALKAALGIKYKTYKHLVLNDNYCL